MKNRAWQMMVVAAVLAAVAWAQAPAPAEKTKKASALEAQEYSEAVAEAALAEIRAGFQGRNSDQVMAAFERGRLSGWASMKERLEDDLAAYESFRMSYQIVRTETVGKQGIAVAEVELEKVPRPGVTVPVRKSATLRLVLERGAKGWRIVDFSPRGFFTE